jgi:hypothetical protein
MIDFGLGKTFSISIVVCGVMSCWEGFRLVLGVDGEEGAREDASGFLLESFYHVFASIA